MRILHTVEHYPPFIGGMSEVVKQLSNYMASFGHDITVATAYHSERRSNFMNGVKVEAFQITGNTICGIQGESQRYQDFLLNGNFDIIVNFAAQQWATDLMLPILNQIGAKKVFVPTGFSALHHPAFQGYFSSLAVAMKQYNMNIFLSEEYQDIEFARNHELKNLCIIPNGASAEEFLKIYDGDIRKELGVPHNHFMILHVGSHTGEKGHREALEIFLQAQIENSAFVIIGNNVDAECQQRCHAMAEQITTMPECQAKGKQVIVPNLTRAETIMAYQTADLFLFPSNIECSPIVLFECMAAKTPFLTTDVGNAKEIVKWSEAGMVLPTTKTSWGLSYAQITESAAMLAELFNNPEKRLQMSNAGFSAWEKQFTWERIAKLYEQVYVNIMTTKNLSRVSVVIPTYNRATTIAASIGSALQQTYPIWEVLVCDDGSTDDTHEIVKSIGDERVKWLPGEHMGRPAIPRNRGIKAATGEWLAFLDSDDKWDKYKVELQLACAEKHGTRAVCSNAHRFLPQQGIVGCLLDCQKDVLTFEDLLVVNNVICSSAMIHRSLLPAVHGFPEEKELTALEDYALWLRVATQTGFTFVNQPLVTYRDSPNTSIRAHDQKPFVQRRHTFSNFLQWVQPQFVEINVVEHALEMYHETLRILFSTH